MAVNIGPKIGIDGEAEYRKALQQIIQETKTLDSEMKRLESSFDKDTSAKEKSRQKSELLKKEQAALLEEIRQLKVQTELSAQKFGEGSAQTLKWKEALANAETKLNNVNGELRENSGWQAFSKSLDETAGKLTAIGDKMTDIGKGLSAKVTAPVAAVGAASVKTAADFEKSMSKVEALSGATGDELAALEAKAREMGKGTKYSATESADALGYMALAGWGTEEMLAGIAPVLNLATAADMDLARASDIVTDNLTAFGKSADYTEQFVDKMAYAMANSNTDVEQLGEAYKNCAAGAASMGYSVDDVTAVLMTMADAGVKGGEAGTGLNAIMTRLATDTKGCAAELAEYGVEVYDAQGNMNSLSSILQGVQGVWAGLTDQEQASLAKTIAGQNHYNQLQVIMAGLEPGIDGVTSSFSENAAALEACSGSAEDMANIMQDNLDGQLTRLKSNVSEAAISIGNALIPMVSSLADKIDHAVTWFNSLDESQQKTIITVAGVAAAIGPVLVVLGTLISSVGTIIGAVSAGIPIVTGMVGAIGAVSAPVLAAVAAISAAIAIGVAVVKNWDTIKAKAKELGNAVRDAFANFKFPHIKMPHFSISGSFSLNPIRVPHLSVDWYAKAMQDGMILNSPTIFGMNSAGRLMGGGEAGAEVVVGAQSLAGMIQSAVGSVAGANLGGVTMNIYGAPGQSVDELADLIGEKLQALTDRRLDVWA